MTKNFIKSLHIPLEILQNILSDLNNYLPDADITEWVDAKASLLNILSNGIWDELVDDLAQLRVGHVTGDDLAHLLSDGSYLEIQSVILQSIH